MFEIVTIEQSWVQIPQTTNDLKSTFFSLGKITLFAAALYAIEFCRNIATLQSMKRRMMVKKNWRKSRLIFLRENKHQVFVSIYFQIFS